MPTQDEINDMYTAKANSLPSVDQIIAKLILPERPRKSNFFKHLAYKFFKVTGIFDWIMRK